MRTNSLGRLSISVMVPSPTSLLPDHLKMAPVPSDGPSKEFLAAGSSFAQGDQACQLWKSFTCANTSDGGAEIVAVRVTRNSAGCMATTTTNTTTIAASARRVFLNFEKFPPRQATCLSAGAAATSVRIFSVVSADMSCFSWFRPHDG